MKLKLLIIFVLFQISLAHSETLYLNTTGANGEYSNLQTAMAAMVAGDTLVIRAGTYTGAMNRITSAYHPPTSSTTWTTIRAEVPGTVLFGDADVNTSYLYVESTGNSHWIFSGITWLGGGTHLGDVDYVKFLRCGAGSNVYVVGGGAIPFSNNVSSYLLYEDCYAWGSGRYKFSSYLSDHNVYRRCVGRLDAIDTSHDGRTEPIGGFAAYGSSYVEFQNCIMIDSDVSEYWTYEYNIGAFICPNGSGSNVAFRGCIALNLDMPAAGSANGFTGTIRDDCVHWDINASTLWGGSTTATNLTIGDMIETTELNYCAINSYGATTSATYSIFYGCLGDLGALYNVTSDYNLFYGNSTNGFTLGAHETTTINPLSSILLYLPRVESGSQGATILKQIGTSGTLWGETGYATTTDTDLWPFPNEDIIKTAFLTYDYAGVDGARGFCATGTRLDGINPITLTSYIWEYLGNEIPADIYGESPVYNAPTITGPSDFSTTSTSVEINGDYTTDSDLPDPAVTVTWTLGESSGFCVAALGVFSCTIPVNIGSNSIVLSIRDSNNGTDTTTVVVTRTLLSSIINIEMNQVELQ